MMKIKYRKREVYEVAVDSPVQLQADTTEDEGTF
jgi:hypothetical protein